MKISTKSLYGLRAMIYLARTKNKICSLKEIAEKEKVSLDYLEKILAKLKKTGLIKAKKGARGGYLLALPPQKIKIKKILETLEGKIIPLDCPGCFKEKSCLAKPFWQKLKKAMESALNLSLKDLVKK